MERTNDLDRTSNSFGRDREVELITEVNVVSNEVGGEWRMKNWEVELILNADRDLSKAIRSMSKS